MKLPAFLTAIAALLLFGSSALCENYLLNGGQSSRIQYAMTHRVHPAPYTERLLLRYVEPASFDSPTYRQQVEEISFRFQPRPDSNRRFMDDRGNRVREFIWKRPNQTIDANISLVAINSVTLRPLDLPSPFPVSDLPEESLVYTRPSKLVQSDHPAIRDRALRLSSGAKTIFDAVQRCLAWVVDHMHYIMIPERFDALYSFKTGKGNCQNYSHLSAALLRSLGVPVRIVNGITFKKPYDVKVKEGILTMKMAQGRHSWIEVFFPEQGWIPFDPSASVLFVSNRFLRVEVGTDNDETINDGLIRWANARGINAVPKLEEKISANFLNDRVAINGNRMPYGPKNILLSPEVRSAHKKIRSTLIRPVTLKPVGKGGMTIIGNLDFPEGIDFLTAHSMPVKNPDGTMAAKRSFLVETAEYVTTKGKQYAQTFFIPRTSEIKSVGLALHRFNEEGQLWIELYRDKDGKPGDYIATSSIREVGLIPYFSGYSWVDFFFDGIRLERGRYWIALGFTGSPVINWFFTYGKSIGPADGTRYRTIFDDSWHRILPYEFNYRVICRETP